MLPVLVGVALLAIVVVGLVARSRRAVRSPRPAAIDSFTLSEPWRRHVAAAQSAQRRYRELTRGVAEGPLRDRLADIERQVQQAVQECFDIARQGDGLDDALARLDTGSLTAQLERATDPTATTSLKSQLQSAGRIRTTRDDTDARLRLLTTRMGELVAQAAEISLGTGTADQFGTTDQLGSGVDDVVTQLEALRLALDDVNSTGRPSTSP